MVQGTRRQFLQLVGAVGAATAWSEAFRIRPSEAASCVAPPSFPAGIDLYQQAYRNWAGDVVSDSVWTCAPASPGDVVTIANWAYAHGYRLRPRGIRHGWSPLTIVPGEDCATPVVLVDTTQHLTGITMLAGAVKVQAGATMDDLLGYLFSYDAGVLACPAPGDITVGGALAIDGHGSAVPAPGEVRPAGKSYGSLSNLVLSVTYVGWDAAQGRYVLKTTDRTAPEAGVLLTQLGRTIITEVTLQVGADVNLRCQSYTNIPATELFAAPGTPGARTVQSFVDTTGRMEVIWFPFTDYPWLKVWSVRPTMPLSSRLVVSPYNYPFSDNVPAPLATQAADIVNGNPSATPTFCRRMYDAVDSGLVATQSADIWGPSLCTLLYVKPTTMKVTANGYAVLCRRTDIQRVVSEFFTKYSAMVADYQSRGLYPMNMPVEVRVTGLDRPGEVSVAGAAAPSLSALRPRDDHPEWDCAVWLDALCLVGTPGANPFYRELEQWVVANYSSYACVRPEWSKGWGYTDAGGWRDTTFIGTTVPSAFPGFETAVSGLNAVDPNGVFTTDLLTRLLS